MGPEIRTANRPPARYSHLAGLVIAIAVVAAACPVEIPAEMDPEGLDDGSSISEGSQLDGVGAEAFTYLRGDTPRLVIEVHAAEGHELSPKALAHLQAAAGHVLDKPGGIEVQTHTFQADDESYSVEDITELTEQRRETSHTPGETASLFVLVLNGEFVEGPVVGVAYSGTAFAVFTEQIEQGTPPATDSEPFERAVLVHELGHLLRLLNVGYTSPREREHPEQPHHSAREDSVMHPAVQGTGLIGVLGDGPPDMFDADDLADLEDLKAGRLP